jgi:hypothetical protein
MMYLMLSYHVVHCRTLKPPSSHEVTISTIVTAANARKRLPPMYAIICKNEDSAGRIVEGEWCKTGVFYFSKIHVKR